MNTVKVSYTLNLYLKVIYTLKCFKHFAHIFQLYIVERGKKGPACPAIL